MDNLTKLRYWTFKILPLVYDDSLSYYEVLAKVTNKVNELVDSNNTMPQAITDEITKQLDENYATDINNKINSAVNTVTENANNQIDKLANEVYAKLITAIATDEGTNTFTNDAKSGGELIFLNGTLYKVTAVLQAGTNYIIGTNIIPVNISEELKTIKETYISSNNEHWNERSTKDYIPDEFLFWKDDLYITTKYIKVNDLLYNSGDNQNIKQITLTSKITNLQSQINGNAENIEKLLEDAINLQNQITTNDTNVNNRISNIVAQSGNDNTEIVDGRKWATVFGEHNSNTIGDAIRSQITELYNGGLTSNLPLIDSNKTYTSLNNLEWNRVYILANVGKEMPSDIPETFNVGSIAIIFTIGNSSGTIRNSQLYINTSTGKIFTRYYATNTFASWNSNKEIYNLNQEVNKTITVGEGKQYLKLSDAINYANNRGNTTILVYPGTYNPYNEGLTTNGYILTNSMKIIGFKGATIEVDLPEFNGTYAPITITTPGLNITLEGLTINASHCRYGIHDECGGGSENGGIHSYKNLSINFLTEREETNHSPRCIGAGLTGNERITIENCNFTVKQVQLSACDFHTDFTGVSGEGQQNKSEVIMTNCYCPTSKIATVTAETTQKEGIALIVTGCYTTEMPTTNNADVCPVIQWNNTIA